MKESFASVLQAASLCQTLPKLRLMAFFVRRGPAHMYFATGDGVLEQMAPDRSSMDSSASGGTILPSAERGSGRRGSFSRVLPPDFLDFVDVFHGDLTCCRLGHYGGQGTCDKDKYIQHGHRSNPGLAAQQCTLHFGQVRAVCNGEDVNVCIILRGCIVHRHIARHQLHVFEGSLVLF